MFLYSRSLTHVLRESGSISLVVLISLLAVSTSFAQAPALPAVQETAKSPNFKDGKVLLEERRIRAYTYLGGDENIIRQTLERIVRQEGDAPGGWVYEWGVLGEYYEDRGDTLLKTGSAWMPVILFLNYPIDEKNLDLSLMTGPRNPRAG